METLFANFNNTNNDLNRIAKLIKEKAGRNSIEMKFKTSALGGNVAQNLYSARKSSFYAPEVDSFGCFLGE